MEYARVRRQKNVAFIRLLPRGKSISRSDLFAINRVAIEIHQLSAGRPRNIRRCLIRSRPYCDRIRRSRSKSNLTRVNFTWPVPTKFWLTSRETGSKSHRISIHNSKLLLGCSVPSPRGKRTSAEPFRATSFAYPRGIRKIRIAPTDDLIIDLEGMKKYRLSPMMSLFLFRREREIGKLEELSFR